MLFSFNLCIGSLAFFNATFQEAVRLFNHHDGLHVKDRVLCFILISPLLILTIYIQIHEFYDTIRDRPAVGD